VLIRGLHEDETPKSDSLLFLCVSLRLFVAIPHPATPQGLCGSMPQ